MHEFEKLGVFYLGRPYDLATRTPRDGLVLYDSRDSSRGQAREGTEPPLVQCRGHSRGGLASSTSRIRRASVSGVKGLSRRAVPSARTPWWPRMSSV